MDIVYIKKACEEALAPIGNLEDDIAFKALQKMTKYHAAFGARDVLEIINELESLREQQAINVNKMVDRFLGWKLPHDFSPDAGISFAKRYNVGTAFERNHEPIGTNLLNADQAKAMIEHMLKYGSA